MAFEDEAQACIDWINSFQANSFIVNQLQDLTDGVVLFEVLFDIDYTWFKTDDVNETRTGNNWIVKKLNLQKMYELLRSYAIGYALHFDRYPAINIEHIAQNSDQDETLKLCKLILFIAFRTDPHCLLSLPERTQRTLNSMIEVYQNYENDFERENEEGTVEELNIEIQQLKEQLIQKDNQLEAQNDQITDLNRKYETVEEQKKQLIEENAQLNDELTALRQEVNERKLSNALTDDMMVDEEYSSNNTNTELIVKLEEQIKQLQAENTTKEAEISEIKNKYEAILQERNSLDTKLKDVQSKSVASQTRINQLEDELNYLKLKAVNITEEKEQGEDQESQKLYRKLLLEKEYLENQNIEQKDLLIEREKTVNELQSTLSHLAATDEDTAKKLVIELQQQLTATTEKLYGARKKLEKAKAFIKEQDNMIKNYEPKNTYDEAVKALQTELNTREQEIMQLKKQMHEAELQARREQRLMMSAWYNVTQKHSMDLVNANK